MIAGMPRTLELTKELTKQEIEYWECAHEHGLYVLYGKEDFTNLTCVAIDPSFLDTPSSAYCKLSYWFWRYRYARYM